MTMFSSGPVQHVCVYLWTSVSVFTCGSVCLCLVVGQCVCVQLWASVLSSVVGECVCV